MLDVAHTRDWGCKLCGVWCGPMEASILVPQIREKGKLKSWELDGKIGDESSGRVQSFFFRFRFRQARGQVVCDWEGTERISLLVCPMGTRLKAPDMSSFHPKTLNVCWTASASQLQGRKERPNDLHTLNPPQCPGQLVWCRQIGSGACTSLVSSMLSMLLMAKAQCAEPHHLLHLANQMPNNASLVDVSSCADPQLVLLEKNYLLILAKAEIRCSSFH